MMPTTTLAEIRKHKPCEDGWRKLLKNLGGLNGYGEHTPVTLIQILDSNGLSDALWCLRACPDSDKFARTFACWCAAQVLHLWDAPQVVRVYLATGVVSLREEAWEEAWAAAVGRAGAAARAAAWAAAVGTAGAATRAAATASTCAWTVTEAAAGAAQADHLRQMCLEAMEQAA